MWPNLQFLANLITFTEEIFNAKLHFFVQCDQSKFMSGLMQTYFFSSTSPNTLIIYVGFWELFDQSSQFYKSKVKGKTFYFILCIAPFTNIVHCIKNEVFH